jgi:N-acyl homoserine lactone hydrolase
MTRHGHHTTARTRGGRGRPDRTRHPPLVTSGGRTRVHAIQTGRLRGNKTTVRGTGPSSLFRRRQNFEWPVLAFVIERPEGHIVIDTGMNAEGWSIPFLMRRMVPAAIIEGEQDEIGPQMEALELSPEDVRTVILTHLDPDHIGGLRWFPNAEVLVHRPEHESVLSWMGKMRYLHDHEEWSSIFKPTLYDMDPEPFGPFPESKALGADGDLRLVPIPGHSDGQVGVILQTDGIALFFAADHIARQDWFVEDWAEGRRTNGLVWTFFWMRRYRKLAAETSRRMHRFIEEVPTVLLPAHDADAPRRLATVETIESP